MADVMKQVVQGVLKGNSTIVSKKVGGPAPVHNTNSGLAGINRPNYQRMKQEQRLSGIGTGSGRGPQRRPVQNQQHKVRPNQKQFNEDSLARLQSVTLSQGNTARKAPAGGQRGSAQDKAKVIGHSRNGGSVWFFPNLPQELMGSFQRPLNRAAVGVIKMPSSLPSYLLLVNDIIREHQDVKFYISWDKSGKEPFTAEFYDDDADRLEKLMNEAFQKLNRRALKSFETYTAVSPSPWLTKQLNLNNSVDAVAFLEGVPYYTNIVLLDTLLKEYESQDVGYEVGENYLLLNGSYHIISKLVTELKKEASRLTSADKLMI